MLTRPFCVIAILILIFTSSLSRAHEYYAGHLKLVHPWAEASEPGDTEASVYFALEDISRDDILLKVTSPLAETIEFRTGRADQAKALSEIKITTGPRIEFLPGKTHLQLKGLKTPLQWARSYPMTFVFKYAGPVNTMVSVGAH
jgi:periplasmic copper chaperone A